MHYISNIINEKKIKKKLNNFFYLFFPQKTFPACEDQKYRLRQTNF